MISQRFSNTLAGLMMSSALILGATGPAYAVNLDQAKSAGMVCELPTGYLQPTGSATPEVKNMVKDINGKRQAEYARIAKEHKVKPEDVGVLTAKKLEPKCK